MITQLLSVTIESAMGTDDEEDFLFSVLFTDLKAALYRWFVYILYIALAGLELVL